MNRIGLSLLAVGICVGGARAGKAKTGAPSLIKRDDPSPVEQSGDMSPVHPAAVIQELTNALGGTWSTYEQYEHAYLTPAGGVGAGEQTFRAGPGGFTLLEDYHSKTPAGELFGFGVVWWNQAKGLQHLWCINVYPTGCEMFPPPPQPGPQWDGKRLVIRIEGEQDGKKTVWLEILSEITPNSFTQTVDLGEAGEPLRRWFTTHAVRKNTTTSSPSSPRSPRR